MPGGMYSVNTLAVTQVNAGQRLPDALMSLTLTHELGHSFGAEHDEEWADRPDCVPSKHSAHGKYIMSMYTSGMTKAHNWMFSKCTRQSMSKIIADGRHIQCLVPRPAAYCGNAVVERGEECDCGTTYSCDVHDRCCVPRSVGTTHPGRACRLKADCSPRVHRCCTDGCAIAAAGVGCRKPTDCTLASVCDGRSRTCPAPRHAANGTSCADGRGHCVGGRCSVSPCREAGLVDCFCRRPLNHACSVCCRCADAAKDACVPAQWLHIAPPTYSLLRLPGSPCVDGGHCDNDGRCV